MRVRELNDKEITIVNGSGCEGETLAECINGAGSDIYDDISDFLEDLWEDLEDFF